jgi:alkylhydroperoxidase family enzyme
VELVVNQTSTCRVPLVDEPGSPADGVFAQLRQDGQPVPNLYRALANAPAVLKGWVDFAWPLREGASPRHLRELAITYLAIRRGSEYVRKHHKRFAIQHGVEPAVLDALLPSGWDRWAPVTDVQRQVLRLVDEVVDDGAASEDTIHELEHRYGVEQAVELVVTVAFYEAVCVVNRSLDVPVETRRTSA